MCGLAGYFSSDRFFDKGHLEAMTATLEKRGPDSCGFFTDDHVGLGHRRLSIIDLSSRANQPMHSANGRYVAIYNGTVYNFGEIGAGLVQGSSDPHTLRTSSDTEVVLEAFVRYGANFVNMLNGMFVIAIYDKEQKELHIFRDRIGIKPLYYYWDGKHFAFASELKALRALSNIPKTLNKSIIRDFLHLGYIPTPHSIYKDIYKMNSGSRLRVTQKGIEELKYWDVKSSLTKSVITDKEEALVNLSDLLTSSIQYQLKSDVPFGIFLSGGIDSSLITAKTAAMSNIKPVTFTLGFEGHAGNEAFYAKIIAKNLGTEHHEFIVSVKDAVDLIDPVFDAFDEPFADSSAIPTMLISKLAKQRVSVALSGEGGDELFMGYGSYQWARRMDTIFFKMFRKPMAYVFSKMPSRYQRISHMLSYNSDTNLRSHIFSQEQYWFSDSELDTLLVHDTKKEQGISPNMPASFLDLYYQRKDSKATDITARKLNAMELQALFDIQFYLQDDLLAKVDRCGMHYALETRVPYLDHRVIEFVINIAPELKYKRGVTKYILNEILYQHMPKKLFERPKEGFDIPLGKWLHQELHYLIEENLNQTIIKKYDLVNYEEVNRMVRLFDNGYDYLYNRLWLLIVLHKWLQKFEAN